MSDLHVLSLFSGIGGLDLGIRIAEPRARTVCYVERDPYAAAVLAARMESGDLEPALVYCDDVRRFDSSLFAGIDLVCGGFPCQPASTAGKRRGQVDDRWLWPDFAGILGECKPRYVFLENVPGLLTVDAGAAFGSVLRSLAALGFDAEWTCVRASDVGAPHRRERVFLLAHAAAPVGDANLARLEGRRAPVVQSGNEIVAWPPGPADDEGWRRWLSAGGPPPAMPRVRRGADGLACRVDRLRCLGNAVVPQQAAFAWRILRERLGCS